MSRFGLGLVLGIGAGLAIGVIMDNIAFGIPIGVGIDLVISAGWNMKDRDSKDNPREE